MPAGLGDIMVIVRAQDFASRTLRRVSGELAGMSRQQALAYQGQLVGLQKMQAGAQMEMAMSNKQMLSAVALRNAMNDRIAAMERYNKAQAQVNGTMAKGAPRMSYAQRWGNLAAAEQGLVKYGIAAGNVATILPRARLAAQNLDNVVSQLPPHIQRAARSVFDLSRATKLNTIDLAKAKLALRDVEIAERQLAYQTKMIPVQRMHDFASAISGVGRAMQLWGAVGTGIFALTSAAAANFSRQVTLAATQTRQVGESFVATARNSELLQRAILQLMTQFPASAEEMSKAAYDIYSSMDVSFGTGIRLLRMFNKVSVAGQVDLATATNASISILENFDSTLANQGKITQRTTYLMNLMFATVRYGRMTFAEFTQMLSSVVPAANNAGQSLDDVAGAMALMTRHVPSQARAATYLARTLQVLTWRDFQQGMRNLGKPIADTSGHLYDFMTVMDQVHAVAERMGVDFNQLIPMITRIGRGFKTQGREGTQMARYGLGILVRYYEELRRVQANVLRDTTEFQAAYKAMSETMGVRWQVMINQFKVLILTIGEQALPAMLKFGDYITTLIDKFKSLSEGTRRNIVYWGAIVSVLTLLGGVTLAVIGVFTGLTAGLWSLAVKLGFAQETGEGVLGRMMTLLSTMRGLAGLGIFTLGVTMVFSQEGIDGRLFGALMAAIGTGLLGGAGRGIGVGSILIGVELFRQGGNWQYLASFLAAAGFVGMRGGGTWLAGFRKGGAAGLITVGVQLIFQGSGWNTAIGAALLALGAGLSTGQPIVIPVVFTATMTLSFIYEADQKRKAKEAALDTINAYKQQLEGLRSAGVKVPDYLFENIDKALGGSGVWTKWIDRFMAVSPFQANKKWDQDAVDAAIRQAKKYVNAWEKEMKSSKWWKAVQAAPANQVYRGLGDYKPPNLKKPIDEVQPSLRTIIKTTEVWTKDQATINRLIQQANDAYKQTASSAEVAVTKIASAVTHGKMQTAINLINQFIAASNKKIDWSNIGKEIMNAFNTGGVQAAVQILQQFAQDQTQAAEDAANAWKQYTEDMKQWNENLKRTMQDATQTTINTLRGLYQQITQQNEQLMGDLFQGPWLTSQTFDLAKEWGITPRVEDIIRDMEDQANRFGRIRNLYASALNKKLPKGFLDEIMKMAPDQALQFFQTLATATPEQVQKIIKLWNQRKAAIKKASKVDFTESINAYRKAGIDMATAMLNGFDSVDLDKQFSTWIKKQFPGLINAAVNQAVAQWKKENPVPTKPTGVAGGGGEAPTQVPTGGGKGKTETTPVYRGGSTEAPTVKAPKIPAPVVDYGAYKKAGVVMGNNIVVGFHSVHVARKIQVNFVPEIIRYNANGRSMGTALGKGIITSWQKQVPQIEHELQTVNFNASIIAFNTAGRRLGNAIILGFQQAKVGVYFSTWINKTFPKLINAAVNEALSKWKKEHPNEVKPGGTGGTTNNTTNNTTNDNRIIVTVPESVGPHVKSNARYVAWLAKHHIRPNQVQNV